MTDARAVSNRFLACDWCGLTPGTLYLPEKYAGVFCEACVSEVVNPAPVTLAADEEAGYVDIGRKLDAYLRTRPKDPVFCGRGRPREKPVETPKLPGIGKWRYFARVDRLRIVTQKRFTGGRARVWACVTDGATVGEVLDRTLDAGLPEAKVVATLRKMVKIYAVLTVERQRAH
jgi:hypothetical protein